jgi:predicted dinucleotide-binding enzyme
MVRPPKDFNGSYEALAFEHPITCAAETVGVAVGFRGGVKVGILGSGMVAQTLAAGFEGRGDEVMLGTRDPAKLSDWLKRHPHARAGSLADAAAFGEIVVLATLGTATTSAIAQAGVPAFRGKVVVDATNPLRTDDSGPHLSVGFDDSLGEQIQRALPEARVVKAFNTVGAAEMVNPQFAGGPPTMFIAGNDAAAKQAVTQVVRDFGWDVADLGGIEAARFLEPMCMAWIAYGVQAGGWHHAFKLLR